MTIRVPLPLLRSPPFPNVPASTAFVSAPCAPQGIDFDPDRVIRLVQSIEDRQIAGDFWDSKTERPALRPLLADPRHAHDALIDRVAYRNPFTGEPATAEQTVELLSFWADQFRRSPGHDGSIVIGAGIAHWKRAQIEQLLWAGRKNPIRYVTNTRSALARASKAKAAIVGWPARVAQDLPERASEQGIPYYQVEDGFIRSVGLGAECHPPFSIVLDGRGMHYDPSSASDLEVLLQTRTFSPDVIARAEKLIALVVAARVSKYEVGGSVDLPARNRRRILVTGQVEDDLSVLKGGGAVAGNLDLLRRARAAEPDAEIWFKPHPDVDAGHRKGIVPEQDAMRYADRVVRGVPMAALFDAIDGIHVLTSLAGFEALLRGLEVVTHGAPFYAGWGLTRDLGIIPSRRTRTLTLAELAAGVLLIYPYYLDPETNLPCTPEILIQRLSSQKLPQETWLTRLRHLQGRVRRVASELRT